LNETVFELKFKNDAFFTATSSTSLTKMKRGRSNFLRNLTMNSDTFLEVFPFNIVIDKTMVITSIGVGLDKVLHHSLGEKVKDIFDIIRPSIDFSWESVNFIQFNTLFKFFFFSIFIIKDNNSSQLFI
jgi:hypothetical protein